MEYQTKYRIGQKVRVITDNYKDDKFYKGQVLTIKSRGEYISSAPGYWWTFEETFCPDTGLNEIFFKSIEEPRKPQIGDKYEVDSSWYFKKGEIVTLIKLPDWFENERSKKEYPRGVCDTVLARRILTTPSNKESEGESEVSRMAEFKVGDKVEIVTNDSGHCFSIGHIGIITSITDSFGYFKVDFPGELSKGNNMKASEVKLVSDATNIMDIKKLTKQQETGLSEDDKALVERGVIKDDLTPTTAGYEYLRDFLFEQNKSALAKQAAKEVAEQKTLLKKEKKS